jgi:hypothetical protein
MKNFLKKTVAGIFCLVATVFANAGFPSGPYIVWVDLEEGRNLQMTVKLLSYIKNLKPNTFCGDTAAGWILYIHSRPDGITNALVENALVNNNDKSKKNLLSLINNYRDKITETNEGLDGVILYSSKGEGRLVSMDAKGKTLSIPYGKYSEEKNEFPKKFCEINPKIYRK